jgi:uncharacterized delta-60 repeat protein
MIQETLSFGITNNTNGVVPVSIFGNTADILDNANVTTRYFWDVTSYTYENNNITLVVTSGGVTTTYTTIFTGTTLEDVVYALNQLGLAYFFLTTSGGSTFINVYTLNYTFGNLTIGNTSILNTFFDPLGGFNSTAFVSSVQSDGKIYYGGVFVTYQGLSAPRIIRLNTDGSIDNSFVLGAGFSFTIDSIKIQSNGKIVVGGGFATYQGTSCQGIVRLESNGSVDAGFLTGLGNNFGVGEGTNDVVVLSSGKILCGGNFTTYGGTALPKICRLNSDGTLDATFNPSGTGFSGTDVVNMLYEQSDTKVIIGGSFVSYKGSSYNRIVRINADGSIDTTFVVGTGFDNGIVGKLVYSIDVQSDGKVLVVGLFSNYQGNSSNNIVRINTDGSIDTSFVVGTGFNDYAYNVKVLPSGKILVVGNFTSYNGTTANRVIRLNSDGSIDTSWDYGTAFDNIALALSLNSASNTSYIGGLFTTFNGVSRVRACSLFV